MKKICCLSLTFALFIGLATFDSAFAAEKAQEGVPAAQIEAEGAYLHENADGQFILKYKGLSKTFAWEAMPSASSEPEIKVFDYDNDGEKEVAVSLCIGKGTGAYIDELHIIKVEKGTLTDYAYTGEDYVRDASKAVTFTQHGKNDEIRFNWVFQKNKTEVTVDITEILKENSLGGSGVRLETGHVVRFNLRDTGNIEAVAALGFSSDENVTPIDVADMTAQVTFSGGKFHLQNIQIAADE